MDMDMSSRSMASSTAMSGMSGMSNMATSTSMAMASSTASSMSMSSSMGMSGMSMTFFTSTATPLFSDVWTPATAGQYAGTCIFLIALAALFRGLLSLRCWLEMRVWSRELVQSIPVAYRQTEPKDGCCTGEKETTEKGHRAWSVNVDASRGVVDVLIVGLGYLLMVAVMTMNVGYFMSVLGGTFLGSVMFGRFAPIGTCG